MVAKKKKAPAKKRVIKKKRSPAQIAATKKLVAMNKARAKKKSRKRVGTSKTKKSMATGKTPSKRLKTRRSKNTIEGMYPNPSPRVAKKFYALTIAPTKAALVKGAVDQKGYFTGIGWDTDKNKALRFVSKIPIEKLDIKKYLPSKRYYSISYSTVN